ncbi:FAD-binding oxidoreductase [Chitinophaga sp. GCM10012297]|uniref:FAD-binding oxidoreductase n=1 Tax=Chitinophaga chungangae TaxID=2821488 RepID=A0ABS3Y9A6_9BACT|nr:FAD-binding oxidoreductase [Chitinophaga chungangae]MBO9151263.1 FAD-binding oxidoreductase [Chitinophaga chungangae]
MALLPKIGEKDPRFDVLLRRNFNKRFTGRPEYIRLAEKPEDVVAAVQEALNDGKRLSVRSGGHCLEGSIRIMSYFGH